MKYTLVELTKISTNMQVYGGSFAEALGIAMNRADYDNLQRIVEAFPEMMEEYIKL